jgi:hypothetical protein
MKPSITLSSSGKGIEYIMDAVNNLQNARVLVGIPEEETSRKDSGPTNAGLLYIHTNGSEVMNIPKRPVIEPAIEDDKAQLEAVLSQAITAQLDGNTEQFEMLLEKAGIRGANDSKRWFTNPNNGWPRNSSRTIRRKLRRLKGEALNTAMAALKDAGDSGDVSEIDTPLIDTGQLRRAITYVVDK